MKYLFLILLVSCAESIVPQETRSVGNTQVSLLFTHEGCKVYRFVDSDRYRYFTNCSETISTYTRSCGENCTEHVVENIKNN